jgi:hypothetical protein
MPYKSESQRGKFHAMEKEGKISKEVVDEFDKASKGKKLPERAGKHAGKHAGKSTPNTEDVEPSAAEKQRSDFNNPPEPTIVRAKKKKHPGRAQ